MTMAFAEPMEPGKPLASYGLDSLGAVELRNWASNEAERGTCHARDHEREKFGGALRKRW